MFNKKIIALMMLVALLAVSAASAEDNITDDALGAEDIEEIVNVEDASLIADDSNEGTFNDLSDLIENTTEGNTLKLDKDYRNVEGSSFTVINKSMTIDGDGHTIDANNVAKAFYINASEFALKNINFINAKSRSVGGAVYFAPGINVNIINCNFTDCYSKYGGALYFDEGSTAVITGSNFINCSAEFAGAIYLENGSVCEITDSDFSYNMAEVLGGSILGNYANVSISRAAFIKSSAKYESGGAITLIYSTFNAEHIEVAGSTSEFGSAITLLDSNSTVSHSTFTGNAADYDGGAIFAMYGSLALDDNTFTANSASRGGAVYIGHAAVNITGNRFMDNYAENGGAIFAMDPQIVAMEGNAFQNNTACEVNQTINDDLTIYSDNYYQFNYADVNITQLPAYYSLFDEGLLTPVKDQGVEGNCWAFCAMATLESCIMKASGFTFDLSEANLKNIMAWYSEYGEASKVNDGGSNMMVYSYFTSWLGPVFEVDDMYYSNDYLSPLLKSIMHIQAILFLERENYTDNDEFKNAIIKYGAISTDMYFDKEYLNDDNVSYYYSAEPVNVTNHGVCIVGWDDSYSRFNFRDTPVADGAWIVRNSWGPDWGREGYFYVSYYDPMFARINELTSYTFILNDTVKYNRIYQFETNHNSYITRTSPYVAYRNIFTAEGDENLEAVSTYFYDRYNYTVKIYINDALRDIISGQSQLGYCTIPLSSPIYLNKNDNVTVEFNITSSNGKGIIPITNHLMTKNLVLKEGVSFHWIGGKWVDWYSDGRVACIKMFTSSLNSTKDDPYMEVQSEGNISDSSFLITVVLPGDATGNVTIDNGEIYTIVLSQTRSVRLYGLNSTNNVLHVTYSGDGKYLEKSLYHTVDVSMLENGTYDELVSQIDDLKPYEVLDLIKDYCLEGSDYIFITSPVTIDGHGHTIYGFDGSGIFAVFGNNTILKNIRFANTASQMGCVYVNGFNCTIENCTFSDNYAAVYGGALNMVGDRGTVRNCTFITNHVDGAGGAIFWTGNDGTISECRFVDNSVLSADGVGGAIYLSGNGISIRDTSFVNNSAYAGGAISIFGNESLVENCNFTLNCIDGIGGAIYLDGVNGRIMASSFANNSARAGGAIYIKDDKALIMYSSFCDNSARYGGAILISADESTVEGCNFTDNTATASGGGAIQLKGKYASISGCMFTANHADEYAGGAIDIEDGKALIKDSTFTGNSAYAGGAISLLFEENDIVNCSFKDDISDIGAAVYCNSANNNLINSTFTNTLNSTQVYWYNESGTITGCKFLNTTTGNVYCMADNLVRRSVAFSHSSSEIEYGIPSIVSISSDDILEDVPILTQLNVKLSKGTKTKTCQLYFKDGVASLGDELSGLDIGTWNLVASFAGDDNYMPSNVSFTLNVISPKSHVDVEVNDTMINQATVIRATVLDSANRTVSQGKITFFDGKTNIGTANVAGGVATLSYTPKTDGEHTITAVYSDSFYSGSNDTAVLLVDSITLTVTAQAGTVGYETLFKANVTGLYSVVNKGYVGFYVAGQFIGNADVANGSASIAYTPSAAGTFTLKGVYGSLDATDSFAVERAESQLSIGDANATAYEEITLAVNVTSPNGVTISEGKVAFFDGDTAIGEADVNGGVARMSYTPTVGGEHTIRAVFTSANYLSSNGTCRMLVDTVFVKVTATGGTVGYNATFTAEVTGLYSTVTGGSVSFYVDTQSIGSADLLGGSASITYVATSAGNAVVKAVYRTNFMNQTSWTVAKAESRLVVYDITGMIVGDRLVLTANVTSPNGLAVNDGTVTFLDNGTTIGSADVQNGISRLNHVISKAGSHVISASYHGNNYLDSSNNVTISIERSVTEMTINDVSTAYCSTPITITANVVSNGNAVNRGIVIFYINGEKAASSSVSNGAASFVHTFATGFVNVTAVYEENEDYLSSAAGTTFTVEKIPTKIASGNVNVAYNGGGNVIATLKDVSGNPLKSMTVVVNKKSLTTDSKGQVKLSVNGWAPKTYDVEISFAGTGIYVKSSAKVKVVISKAASKLTASKKTYKAKVKTKKYAVTLKDIKGKAIAKAKLTLKIKGKTYKATTNTKGKATFKMTKFTKKGKHTATVKFAGDKFYKGVTKKVKITVK